ncbi:esterase/lipase family protein [Streptomyces sp. IBSNAI002]|uniref:esterase/lipase family protein n=1 Tax=Streptomyces sp. IBSNAI002 TaxID=3457500 RepID=UPI003FD317A2
MPFTIRLRIHRPTTRVVLRQRLSLVFAAVCTLTAAAVSAAPSASAASTAGAASAAVSDPVVFVHGLNSDSGVWDRAAKHFTDNRFGGKLHTFDYRATTHEPIENNADRLWEWMEKENLSGKRVNFVAHSLGGLVTRKMALDHNRDFTLSSLVTLATPNHGSKFADVCVGWEPDPRSVAESRTLCNSAVLQMKSDSRFLDKLNGATEFSGHYNPGNTLTYAITGDGQVDTGSVSLAGATNKTFQNDSEDGFGGAGVHTSITGKSTVLEDALDFVEKANGNDRVLASGPALHDSNCWMFYPNSGTISWRLPGNAPPTLKAEITRTDGKPWTVPASDKGKHDLPNGAYRIRFVDPSPNGYSTAYSTFRFHGGTWACEPSHSNTGPELTTWPASKDRVRT